MPHTGDIPNTVMTTAQSGIIFSPHNCELQPLPACAGRKANCEPLYSPADLLNDPSRASRQMIRIDYNSSASGIVSAVKTFGSSQVTGEANLTALVVDYWACELKSQ